MGGGASASPPGALDLPRGGLRDLAGCCAAGVPDGPDLRPAPLAQCRHVPLQAAVLGSAGRRPRPGARPPASRAPRGPGPAANSCRPRPSFSAEARQAPTVRDLGTQLGETPPVVPGGHEACRAFPVADAGADRARAAARHRAPGASGPPQGAGTSGSGARAGRCDACSGSPSSTRARRSATRATIPRRPPAESTTGSGCPVAAASGIRLRSD